MALALEHTHKKSDIILWCARRIIDMSTRDDDEKDIYWTQYTNSAWVVGIVHLQWVFSFWFVFRMAVRCSLSIYLDGNMGICVRSCCTHEWHISVWLMCGVCAFDFTTINTTATTRCRQQEQPLQQQNCFIAHKHTLLDLANHRINRLELMEILS